MASLSRRVSNTAAYATLNGRWSLSGIPCFRRVALEANGSEPKLPFQGKRCAQFVRPLFPEQDTKPYPHKHDVKRKKSHKSEYQLNCKRCPEPGIIIATFVVSKGRFCLLAENVGRFVVHGGGGTRKLPNGRWDDDGEVRGTCLDMFDNGIRPIGV